MLQLGKQGGASHPTRIQRNQGEVTWQHEDHWLSRSETPLQMLQATAAFLRANKPPD